MSVVSCGCLGLCGSGPNVAVLPEGAIFRHCSTASRVSDLLAGFCGVSDAAAYFVNSSITKAFHLKPSGGMHFIYKARSAVRLSTGDLSGALQDSTEASKIAPHYAQAYICQGDAFFAMEEYAAAEQAYSTALQVDPSLHRSKSFKARTTKLQEKTAAANIPQL